MSLGMSRDQRVTDTKVEIAKRLRKNATPAEALLWEALRGRRHTNLKFRRQQVIAGYIVDFYCEEKDLAVELDGSIHDSEEARRQDALREERLRARGIKILRFDNAEVLGDLSGVLQRIS
jgi:very-short-patch-repair endonuclease